MAGFVDGSQSRQRSNTAVTRCLTVAPAVAVIDKKVTSMEGRFDQVFTCNSAIFGEGQPEADDQTTSQAIALANAICCCQQGQSLQQPHL